MAFSPDFTTNKKCYVYYSAPANSPHINYKNVLVSFTVPAKGSDKADMSSEHILMHFQKQQTKHNGSDLQFDPDGYLYLDLGDGGGDNHWTIYNMPPGEADKADIIKPIIEYDHKTTGIAIVGGYVYPGKAIPALEGKYVFGDYNGCMFYLPERRLHVIPTFN